MKELWQLLWLPAVAWTLLLRPAVGIRECEQQRLESTEMKLYGTLKNRTLQEVGLDAIYIVHYTPYGARRLHMQQWLDEHGLQAYFVTGWDRKVATNEDIKCMYPSNALFEKVALARHFDASWLEVRELTLAMKHASAWYAAWKNKHRHILVLEDDAIMADDFMDTIRNDILGNEDVRENYDVLHVGSFGPDPDPSKVKHRTFPNGENRGGVGYFLSQAGAAHLMKQNPILSGTADHMLSNGCCYPNPPPRRWVHRPWLVWQGERDARHLQFGADHANPAFQQTYCWTPDMHACQGRLCFLSPKFVDEYQISEGIVPTHDSLYFKNGTVATRSESLAFFKGIDAAPSPAQSLRGRPLEQ